MDKWGSEMVTQAKNNQSFIAAAVIDYLLTIINANSSVIGITYNYVLVFLLVNKHVLSLFCPNALQ